MDSVAAAFRAQRKIAFLGIHDGCVNLTHSFDDTASAEAVNQETFCMDFRALGKTDLDTLRDTRNTMNPVSLGDVRRAYGIAKDTLFEDILFLLRNHLYTMGKTRGNDVLQFCLHPRMATLLYVPSADSTWPGKPATALRLADHWWVYNAYGTEFFP